MEIHIEDDYQKRPLPDGPLEKAEWQTRLRLNDQLSGNLVVHTLASPDRLHIQHLAVERTSGPVWADCLIHVSTIETLFQQQRGVQITVNMAFQGPLKQKTGNAVLFVAPGQNLLTLSTTEHVRVGEP